MSDSHRARALRFTDKHRVDIVEVDVERPAPGEVLIEVRAAGLCGSDMHYYHMTPEEMQQGAQPRDPRISPGHEIAGVVVETGPGVGFPRVGDRVFLMHYSGCGSCEFCRVGLHQHCKIDMGVYSRTRNGGMQERVIADAADCVSLPDDIDFATGSFLACGASTAYCALKHAQAAPGDTVFVVGAGPVGLAVLAWAAALGLRAVATDMSPERIAFAKSLGHAEVFLGSEFDLDAVIPGGADIAIDTSGNRFGRDSAVRSVRDFGTVVLVGLGGSLELDPVPDIILRQLTIRGLFVFSVPELMEASQQAVARGVGLSEIITRVAPLDEGARAFADFANDAVGKFVLQP
ncbi:alcohol dehydrogenase catalytic domain-containing protein [Leucobacter allii]|uniref:Alcohol dehydrogenase catalytic domain-containing protein n=1 Tax=Leucobacter allii TaxID=2932247 RepID=A0ABY4FNR8_9MICO|nr:alcohol dehydrogenase catalytic domain-containing protein [Leucobacter allii]UOQ57854.1 alcohol dehydrogenase catalytic domain-containing protein [Leucobacter allii]